MKILKKILLFIVLLIVFLYKELLYLLPFTFFHVNYQGNYQLQALGSLISSIVFVLILILIYKKYLKEKWMDFRKNFNNYFDFGLKFWFIGLLGMFICNLLIVNLTSLGEANNEVLVQNMLKQAPLFMFLNASFVGPFAEEMLFRKSLGDIFGKRKIMVVMSGLVFGLLHVVFSFTTPLDFLYVIPYGLLGGAFAYILYKTDNVFISVMFHTIHNTILTLLSIL